VIGITTYVSGTKLGPLETESRLPQLLPLARPTLTSPCSCQPMALAGAASPFSALNQTPAVLYCAT
jgi:hypothetical protein